jgi:hypothetical protein
MDDVVLLAALIERANDFHAGHFTITTNWRVGFGTPANQDYFDAMSAGKTFAYAASNALRADEENLVRPICSRTILLSRHRETWRV